MTGSYQTGLSRLIQNLIPPKSTWRVLSWCSYIPQIGSSIKLGTIFIKKHQPQACGAALLYICSRYSDSKALYFVTLFCADIIIMHNFFTGHFNLTATQLWLLNWRQLARICNSFASDRQILPPMASTCGSLAWLFAASNDIPPQPHWHRALDPFLSRQMDYLPLRCLQRETVFQGFIQNPSDLNTFQPHSRSISDQVTCPFGQLPARAPQTFSRRGSGISSSLSASA